MKIDMKFRLGKLPFGWFTIVIGLPSKRDWKFFWQRLTRGWSDEETWNLNDHIAEFVLPRLKRFREIQGGYPSSLESKSEWILVLDKMIYAFESHLEDDPINAKTGKYDQEKVNRTREGLKLFGKYFVGLWW